jgi:hypothetical protein
MEKILHEKELFVIMAIGAWQTQNTRMDQFLSSVSDELLDSEIAPGKNRGTYLLGHLTAVSDNLFHLFGLGERMHPGLDKIFIDKPDKSGLAIPATAELRSYWKGVNDKLASQFAKMTIDDWFSRHSAVPAEDFAKEPHRNKLNVLLNRTSHQAYHLGQLILLKRQ